MRKSKSSYLSRLLGAGIAASTVTAITLVAPSVAWAAVTGTTTPNIVVPNTSGVIVENSTYTYGAGHYAQVQTGTACASHYTTQNSTTIWDAAQTTGAAHQISVTIPASVTVGDRGAAKSQNICVYDTNSTTTSTLLMNSTVYTTTSPTLSTTAGPTAGGNLLTLNSTAGIFTGLSGIGAIFVLATANCPTTYGATPTANMFATDPTRVSNTQATLTVPSGVTAPDASTAPVAYNICLFNGTAAASTLLSDAAYSVNRVVLSQNSGPTGGGNGLTVTAADPTSTIFSAAPGIVLRTAACAGTHYSTAAAGSGVEPIPTANVRRLSDSQIAFSVPSDATYLLAGTWNICMYDSTTNGAGSVIASATYVLMAAVTLSRISPAAGPTNGGTRITVYGANFPTTSGAITATLGGVPLVNITPSSSGAFYATTPAHSPDNASTLVITTATGTTSLQNAFAFQNAISVTPRTSPNTTPTIDVQVTGSGFLNNNFGASASYARIFLVDGTYNPADEGAGNRSNGPMQECGNVLRVSDSLVVCTLTLNRRLDETGVVFDPFNYTATWAGGATPDPTSKILDLTSDTATWKDVGQAISGTSIAGGTTIAAVLSPTRILLSQYPTAVTATGSITVGGAIGAAPVHTITGNTTTQGVSASVLGGNVLTVLGGTGSPLTQADVGRVIYGATTHAAGSGIDNGTTITSVSPDGMSATLSAAAKGTLTGVTIKLFPANPVPNGAYTLTVVNDGSVDANTTNANYQQSAVTSGATFTVAPA